jgi:hypothetical protein
VIEEHVRRRFRARPQRSKPDLIPVDEDFFPSSQSITGERRPAVDDDTPGLNQTIDFAT